MRTDMPIILMADDYTARKHRHLRSARRRSQVCWFSNGARDLASLESSRIRARTNLERMPVDSFDLGRRQESIPTTYWLVHSHANRR